MKRWQILILVGMAFLAIVLFCGVATASRAVLSGSPLSVATSEANAQAETDVVATRRAMATATATPTHTPSPTATDTPQPTPTNTRVVLDTATPTPSRTPTPGPTATNTLVVPSSGYSGGTYAPPTPTSRYQFRVKKGPVTYSTTNYFFVILAQVISGDVPQPGYKLKGTFSPSGFNFESTPSCPDLCKASGVESITDDSGNVTYFGVQKGNVAFEAPIYENGTWQIMLVDEEGRQASEVLTIETNLEDRQWFYYEFVH